MADSFRIAVSSDFIKPDGSPAFPMFDMTPLDDKANVEWKYLEDRDGPVSVEELAGHDALILLGQRFDRSSVPSDGRLAQSNSRATMDKMAHGTSLAPPRR